MKGDHPMLSAVQYLQSFQVHDRPIAVLIRLQEPVDALQAAATGHMLHLAIPQLSFYIRLHIVLQHVPSLGCKGGHQAP